MPLLNWDGQEHVLGSILAKDAAAATAGCQVPTARSAHLLGFGIT